MRNFLSISILSAAAAVAAPAFGQAPAQPAATPPPLPPGPLIQKAAPASAEWSITYKYGSGSGGAPEASPASNSHPAGGGEKDREKEAPNFLDKVVLITKTGDDSREVTTTASSKAVAYYSHNLKVVYAPNSKTPSLEGARQSSDYPGFDWISEKNYVGIAKSQGRDCLIFQGKAKATEMEMWQGVEAPKESFPASAVIDVETRLPFSLKIGQEVRTYRYGSPPTEPLVLPPEAQALIAARLKLVQQQNIKPPPP